MTLPGIATVALTQSICEDSVMENIMNSCQLTAAASTTIAEGFSRDRKVPC
jgi:hypothetical protein